MWPQHQESPLSVVVTAGLGFSVLAGLFGGVVYVLSQGISKKPRIIAENCNLCGEKLEKDITPLISCIKCKQTFCTKPTCIKQLHFQWICNKCHQSSTCSWFSNWTKFLQLNSKVWPSTMTGKKEDETKLSEEKERKREEIRDFIEKLVEALLGGELDAVSVNRIYDDQKYLPISGESPCTAHATLKTLIQNFIRDASQLPKLKTRSEDQNAPSTSGKEEIDKTYEDLLSTAIINKVIQNYQEGKQPRSLAGSSRSSSPFSKINDKEYYLGERNLENSREDASSSSSMDEWTKQSTPMSFSIHKSIEEVTSSDEEDEVDSKSIRQNDWQENWYLRKRKFGNTNNTGTQSPVPVPMLVPNPTSDAKVLIGDRDAEDTTDLSDAVSDYEDTPEPNSLNAVIVNSKTLIGGRNPLESLVAHSAAESEDNSENVVDNFISVEEGNGDLVESTNEILVNGAQDGEDLVSLDSHTEKDLEYTEKYATLPKRVHKNPLPAPRVSKLLENETESIIVDKTDTADSGVTSDEDEKQRIFKGSYSEREKEKWNHGVELNNNPYSKCNLENRLSNRSSLSSLNSFNTDFCIKSAANPNGGTKRDFESEEQKDTFTALPVMVRQETGDPETLQELPSTWDISSDSDYSIERTYNVDTGKITRKVGENEKDEKEYSENEIDGILYAAKEFDENQNDLEPNRDFLLDLKNPDEKGLKISSPLPDHFKILSEIANENPSHYQNDPISPPAEFKSSIIIENDTIEDPIEQEIAELKEKQVVKNLLEVYTHVEQNINNNTPNEQIIHNYSNRVNNNYDNEVDIELIETSQVPSVKLIKEIFNAESTFKPEVYSLTARSIPSHVREGLKNEQNFDEAPSEIINVSNANNHPTPEFPKAKSKIEYFEKIAKV